MSDTEHTDDFEPTRVFPQGGETDLRPGSDDCYKCSTCDVSCPVAEVDDEFPGPKFQGPEQWRLKRKEDVGVDPSIEKCSNCMRCDDVCPSGVPLSQMHNTARAEYVDEEVSTLSRKYVRDRLLSNYGRLGAIAARVPRLTNAVANNGPIRWLTERLLGISAEREFPAFARRTFREWYDERGGLEASRERAREARKRRDDADPDDRKGVAYFHGDYANYNTVGVATATVRVFERFGYEVAVPEQRCSGTPMFANGMLEDAERAAAVNADRLSTLVEEGYDVVCSCTSCSMALRKEYPELFDHDGIDSVAANTYEAVEYLRIYEDLRGELEAAETDYPDLAYHAPCHARNQGIAGQPVELLPELDGLTVEDVGDSCSGISGTYGWKRENYGTSMAVGEEMFEEMRAAEGEVGLTECPTCAMQMEHGTGYRIDHPMEVLEAALVED